MVISDLILTVHSKEVVEERPTLHLPDFQRSHFICALNKMLPQFLQLLLQLRIHGPDIRKTDRETCHSPFNSLKST